MVDCFKIFDDSGYTSTIYYLPGEPPRVCKSFSGDFERTHFPVEKEAYERFSSAHTHPSSILKYYGVHDSIPAGITLELAEHKNIARYCWEQRVSKNWVPTSGILYRWAGQAAQALEFAHSQGVYNCDIHWANFFLDQDLNLKVGDWAGASIDGLHSTCSYRLRCRLFDAEGVNVPRGIGISAVTEIFALGSALYYLVTGKAPWSDLREPEHNDEVKRRIQQKEFPETDKLPVLGDVISKCWNTKFASMTEVKHAVEAEEVAHLG